VISHRKRWLLLLVIVGADAMDMLDGTVVNVAAPTIHQSLRTSTTGLQWIVAGYSLSLAVGLLVGARLGDVFGRRALFLVGLAGFTAASTICGLAATTTMLIAARVGQGLAGALMLPQGFPLLREAFSEREMPKVFGVYAPAMGGAMMLGPILGGGLVSLRLLHEAWRPVFLVNVPVGLAAGLAAIVLLPRSSVRHAERLDSRGAMIAAFAVFALIYPLMEGRELGWPAWTFASIAVSLALLVLLAAHLLRERRRGRDPLVEPGIFARAGYSPGALIVMLYFGGMGGAMLAVTLFLQLGERFSAVHAGLTVAPLAVGAAIAAPLAGRQMPRLSGRALIQVGVAVSLAGCSALAVVLGSVAHVSSWGMLGPLLVVGFGLGIFVVPGFDTILGNVTAAEVGSASGVLNALQQLAGAIGVAALGTVFFSALHDHGFETALRDTIWSTAAGLLAALLLSPLLPATPRAETSASPGAGVGLPEPRVAHGE
jgi:EmrB/QacA subfamily drug resistance transporter